MLKLLPNHRSHVCRRASLSNMLAVLAPTMLSWVQRVEARSNIVYCAVASSPPASALDKSCLGMASCKHSRNSGLCRGSHIIHCRDANGSSFSPGQVPYGASLAWTVPSCFLGTEPEGRPPSVHKRCSTPPGRGAGGRSKCDLAAWLEVSTFGVPLSLLGNSIAVWLSNSDFAAGAVITRSHRHGGIWAA